MPIKTPVELCVKCKGYKRLCGRTYCPILLRFRSVLEAYFKIKGLEVYGSTPPGIVVGEYGYPEVNLSPVLPPVEGVNARVYDDPEGWWGKLRLKDVIRYRASSVYPKLKVNVNIGKASRLPSLVHEIMWSMVSSKPVDMEVRLKRLPIPTLKFDGIISPVGPTAPLERLRVTGNPKVNPILERLALDTDVKAKDAIWELYIKGVNVYDIIRAMSVGILGRSVDRRIVPTRWSITAVDVTLGEQLRRKVRSLEELGTIKIYKVEYLHNNFVIILLPGPYSFEMVEIWHPKAIWTREAMEVMVNVIYELWDGVRRGPMDGGYYAMRFGVLEGLYYKVKRQATVVAIREVLPEYSVPVGNWHIRESVRRAFSQKPLEPRDLKEVLDHLDKLVRVSKSIILKNSKLLRKYLTQQVLSWVI